jgi:hypothetical protein
MAVHRSSARGPPRWCRSRVAQIDEGLGDEVRLVAVVPRIVAGRGVRSTGEEEVGKPVVWMPRKVFGPSAQWSASATTLPAADPHARQRAGAEVESGRPHDDVELPLASVVSIPLSVTRTIGVCLRSTSSTLGLLYDLVIAGHEGRPLLGEAMVLGDQLLGGLGVLDDARILSAMNSHHSRWRHGRHHVGVVAGQLGEPRTLPHLLEERQALLDRVVEGLRDRARDGGTPTATCSASGTIASKPP